MKYWIKLDDEKPTQGFVCWRDPNNVIWVTDYAGLGGTPPTYPHKSPIYWTQLPPWQSFSS